MFSKEWQGVSRACRGCGVTALWHTRRMPMPLIATDLDGTLLMTGSHEPHPDAVEAIHRALAAGIQVVLATGRAPIDVVPIAEIIGHRWFAVCCDGTTLVDLAQSEVISTTPISSDTKRQVVSRLRSEFDDVRFLIDRVSVGAINRETYGLVFEEGFEAPWAWALDGAQQVSDIDEILDDPTIVKMCAYRPTAGDDIREFHRISAVVEDLVTTVRINSDQTFVDMCARGVSKASGVATIAEMLGIASDHVFAVGDLHNDIEMLSWAGFSFAVANAHDAVREIADVIVPANDDGGVAHVIEAALEHLRAP